MSEIIRRYTRLLCISVISSIVSSLSLPTAILVNSEGKNKIVLVLFGLVFWIGLIVEQVSFWKSYRIMKRLIKYENRHVQGRSGIFSLAKTIEGIGADVIFILSTIALMVCILFGLGESFIQYILICLLTMSFRLHCIFNGKNFKYKKLLVRKVEQKND